MKTLGGPWSVISAPLFATLYGITARYDDRYPCAAPHAGVDAELRLVEAFERAPGARANDGVVPLRSQIWGKLVWAGYGDHLDVLGHFRDASPASTGRGDGAHVDWLASGANFDRAAFADLMRAIAHGMLNGPKAPPQPAD
jgi:hypothetical protein